MKLLSLRVDKIVAVSRDVKIFSEKKLGRSISVVPNPSTFVKSKSLKIKRPNHFVFIGRLVEQKNPTLLLHSFAKFLDLFDVNSFLHIIGDGPLLSRLQILTKTLEIDNKCFFYGALAPKKVEEILLKSRTLVSTSVIEGMPLVRLEAFATGCCVVTTNTGGTHFFSSLRDKGLFVSKSDQLDIANKMYRSLSQNYWTRQQVQSRMNIIQKFNPTKISEKLIQ
jgi:glycosyltransferase involved in cell wall biosynthesis